jgi:hypothetical protein
MKTAVVDSIGSGLMFELPALSHGSHERQRCAATTVAGVVADP